MSFDTHQLNWLVLHLVPGLGSRRCAQFLAAYGTPDALLGCSPAELRRLRWSSDLIGRVLTAVRDPWQTLPELKRLANWAAVPGQHLLTPAMPDYPWRLAETLTDPPPVLYVRGNPALLNSDQVAVVGSRRPSPPNRQLARDWSAQWARAGLTITSGLAHGIDGAAHQGALAGQGKTVAVLGSGLDNIYPVGHQNLLADIVAHDGTAVSELPPWTPPKAGNFPRRNRLVAALAQAVLVVEAAERSGSLITARLAGEYGRDVMAVPGHPLNPGCAGSNRLLQDGAQLMTCWQDIDTAFALEDAGHERPDEPLLPPAQAVLLSEIGTETVALETLAHRLECSPYELYEPLMALELAGLIAAQGSSYMRIR